MEQSQFKFNPEDLNFNKLDNSLGTRIWRIVIYVAAVIVIAILLNVVYSLFFDTPRERQIRRENEMLQQNALEVGQHLLNRLNELKDRYDIIGDVRGLGLFVGVELVLDRESLKPATGYATYIINRMKERGILLSTDGPLENVLKIKPPVVFTEDNADFMVETLESILREEVRV